MHACANIVVLVFLLAACGESVHQEAAAPAAKRMAAPIPAPISMDQAEAATSAAQRKALSNETEKILLHVDYRPEPTLDEAGVMQPLMEARRGTGRTFSERLATDSSRA